MGTEAQKYTLFLGCKRISQNTFKANNNKPDNIEKIPKNATFYRAFYFQNLVCFFFFFENANFITFCIFW